MHEIKCVLVGDSGVGKTSLLVSYFVPDSFDSNSPKAPPTWESYATVMTVGDKMYSLKLSDTKGSDTSDSVRPEVYPDAQVFLVCFAVNDRMSHHHVRTKWFPEIRKHNRFAPILLVGTKADTKEQASTDTDDATSEMVLPKDCAKLSKQIGAKSYLECSSKSSAQLSQVFQEAIEAGRSYQKLVKSASKCQIF